MSILGFGFDHVGFDFKVARVVRGVRTLVAEVYSSNRNCWRKIGSKPFRVAFTNCFQFDVSFHGYLFAVEQNSSMMAFDLNKEVFIWNINLPVNSFYDGDNYYPYRVAEFKDNVAVSITHMEEGKIQLWTLDDEACLCDGGVNASWTKVLTVDVGVTINFVGCFFNNVHFALNDEEFDGFLYDLNKKWSHISLSILILKLVKFPSIRKACFHLEDLNESGGLVHHTGMWK